MLWRPGCPHCAKLRRELARRGVSTRWRNIWQDDAARSLVRAANNGNETVPTVRIGDRTLTNPSWRQLAPLLGDGPWLAPSAAPRSGRTVRVLSWLPVVALVVASFALDAAGHSGASWAVDPFAVAAWWLTRPLRR
ncbi:MAG: glutaredoxin family protein [Sciscionella sp.]